MSIKWNLNTPIESQMKLFKNMKPILEKLWTDQFVDGVRNLETVQTVRNPPFTSAFVTALERKSL